MNEAGSEGGQSMFSRLMELVAASHGAVVNLHDVADVTARVPGLRLKPEQHTHHGGYCRFAKFTDNNKRCSQNKLRSLLIAEGRDRAFWGCCPFGVWDLAQPLKFGGKLQAVLYVGHFREGGAPLPVGGREYPGPALPEITRRKITDLKKAALHLEEVFRLILGEWSRRHGPVDFGRDRGFYRSATTRFLESRYSENVNLQDLARELRVHPHYLGKVVAGIFKESFKSLLRRRRVDEAKLLLCSTDKGITEIAFASGFQDSNYFSTVFLAFEGVTPSEYRRLKKDGAGNVTRGKAD